MRIQAAPHEQDALLIVGQHRVFVNFVTKSVVRSWAKTHPMHAEAAKGADTHTGLQSLCGYLRVHLIRKTRSRKLVVVWQRAQLQVVSGNVKRRMSMIVPGWSFPKFSTISCLFRGWRLHSANDPQSKGCNGPAAVQHRPDFPQTLAKFPKAGTTQLTTTKA